MTASIQRFNRLKASTAIDIETKAMQNIIDSTSKRLAKGKPAGNMTVESDSNWKSRQTIAAAIACGLFVCSCASPGIKRLDQPLASSPLVGDLINSNRLTPGTRAVLGGGEQIRAYRRDPAQAISALREDLGPAPTGAERLALIELCSDTGDRLADEDSRAAVGYHLAAAELAFEPAIAAAGSGKSDDAPLAAAYNHSAGRVATILFNSAYSWNKSATFAGPWKNYRLRYRSSGASSIDPAEYDSLESADRIELRNYEMERIRSEGIGAAMIVHRKGTDKRREKNPFLSPIGMTVPVNALLDFGRGGGEVELRLTDLLLTNTVAVRGRKLPAAADLTVPLVVQADYDVDRKAGFKAMTHPDKYLDHTGLYQLEPFRPDQIPIILVHGLMSNPEIWLEALNELRADPKLRDKYQLMVFRYSTGFPIVYNSAFLRERLQQFQERYDPGRRNPHFRQMILVGHSMGGVLSNAQVRPSGNVFKDFLFDRPIEDLDDLTEEQKRTVRDILIFEANPNVSRVICLAAPHRGSNIATSPIGNLGHKLVSFPREIFMDRSLVDIEGLTEAGREVIEDRPDSVRGLKPGSPVLTAILENPVRDGVAVHSIIGRHKPEQSLEESSDTVVPYTSAHLDEAVSEKVVHATHTTICKHPEAVEEMRRILYRHAGLGTPRESE